MKNAIMAIALVLSGCVSKFQVPDPTGREFCTGAYKNDKSCIARANAKYGIASSFSSVEAKQAEQDAINQDQFNSKILFLQATGVIH